MIAMSREEVSRYLNDYFSIRYLSMKNPDEKLGKIFDLYMLENKRIDDCNVDYYNRMCRVYEFFCIFKMFSYTEDYLLNQENFVNDRDLDGLRDNIRFFSSENNISNKNIVMYIRNAFNHNDDSNHSKFNISVNGRYCEIDLLDVRTDREKRQANSSVKPFNIKLNIDQLIRILNSLMNAKKNVFAVSFDIDESFDILSEDLDTELNKIFLLRYYFPRKLDEDAILKFKDSVVNSSDSSLEEILEKSNLFHSNAKEQEHIERKFSLTQEQKDKIKMMISYTKDEIGVEGLKLNSNFYMYVFLKNVIPMPLFRFENYLLESRITTYYMYNFDLSYNDIIKRIYNLYTQEDIDDYDEVDMSVHNIMSNFYKTKASRLRNFMSIKDGYQYMLYPMITYIDAVISHLCMDEVIDINGQQYNREQIRNSLVHGRWYFSGGKNIELFDASPRNLEDYNFHWHETLNLEELKKWADSYVGKLNSVSKRSKK